MKGWFMIRERGEHVAETSMAMRWHDDKTKRADNPQREGATSRA